MDSATRVGPGSTRLKKLTAKWRSRNSEGWPVTHVYARRGTSNPNVMEVGYMTSGNQWWWIVRLRYDATTDQMNVIRDRRVENVTWPPEQEK